MFPSKHQDEARALEQQRGLASLIDFFVPQSAAEAGLMLAAGPIAGKAVRVAGKASKAARKAMSKIPKSFDEVSEDTFFDNVPSKATTGLQKSLSKINLDEADSASLEALNKQLRDNIMLLDADNIKAIGDIERALIKRGKQYGKQGTGTDIYKAQKEGKVKIYGGFHGGRKSKYARREGGMIKQYQQGGQMQPRKQQEIRNPQMYGPPDSLMGPDTTMGNLDDLLNYYMESDRRNQLNALTGDTIDPQLDSLRLLQRMKKSKMPRTGRKSMQKGGQVLGKGQPLERRPSPSEQLAAMQAMEARPQDSLMSSIGEDKRVRPADRYIIKDGTMSRVEMEVPKLSSAYLQSFGMETPLSKRQNNLLRHRALSPETLGINPEVQSLLGKALVQRLANEPI